MKKSLLLGTLLASATSIASAQSAVTIYGTADLGLVNERGGAAGSVNLMTSGVASSSRLGFRGTEDLGGGLSAVFVMEMGMRMDTGAIDSAGTIFNRQSFVGLKSKDMGTVTLGRQYIPLFTTLGGVADPFAGGYAGSAKNLFPSAGALTRNSNMIYYVSPVVDGFSGDFAYSLGELGNSNSAGRQIGASFGYSKDALNVRLAVNYRNNDTVASGATAAVSRDIGRNLLLAANYNFGVAKVFGAYGVDKGPNSAPLPNANNPFGGVKVKPVASLDGREFLIGVSVPFGQSTFMASYIRKDDKTALNQDASQFGIGYTYAMSKRTTLYTSYAAINNKNGAGYTVGNSSEAGSGDKAFNFGVRHTF